MYYLLLVISTLTSNQVSINSDVYVTTEDPPLYFFFEKDSVFFMANPYERVSQKVSYKVKKDSVFIPPTPYNGLFLDNHIYFNEFTLILLPLDKTIDYKKKIDMSKSIKKDIREFFLSKKREYKDLKIDRISFITETRDYDTVDVWIQFWHNTDNDLTSRSLTT